jgi:hypothetical protein
VYYQRVCRGNAGWRRRQWGVIGDASKPGTSAPAAESVTAEGSYVLEKLLMKD